MWCFYLSATQFVRDNYATRFPELETLVDNPYDYIKASQAIGNPPELDDLSNKLKGVLPPAQIMVVTVEATTTRGKQMTDGSFKAVEKACAMCLELDSARRKVDLLGSDTRLDEDADARRPAHLPFADSRICRVENQVPRTESQRHRGLTNSNQASRNRGGLERSKQDAIFEHLRACTLVDRPLKVLLKSCALCYQLLGAQKKLPTGFSTSARTGNSRHTGFIFQSDLVQSTPAEYRMKAQRTVAAKCTLACRMDIQRAYPDGSYGEKAVEDLERKLEKLAEPPPAKITKALPVPVEGGNKKRRGGKRARKAKEAHAMTELQKLQNRMVFGEEEEEAAAFDETMGLGMAGSSSGKMRQLAGEARTKAKMSKSNKSRLAALNGSSSNALSGTASSISFTPHQGVEFVDPTRRKAVADANDGWFAEGSFSVVNRPTGIGSTLVPAGQQTFVKKEGR